MFIQKTHHIGYDTESSTIVERAREVLTRANIPQDSIRAIAATRMKGSMAELFFHTRDDLSVALVAVKSLRKKFGDRKNVWLDVKKTPSELLPNKIVHRTHAFLTDVEKGKEQPAIIEKDIPKKTVSRGGQLVGKIEFGRWRWTPWGLEIYDEATRGHAEHWATHE